MIVPRPASGLRIAVLGPLEVSVDGHPLVTDTRKAQAILALLAVEGRPYARDELVALFWPDAGDEAARGSLRRTLSTLRTALRDRYLLVDRNRIALASDDVAIDLEELAAVATSGEPEALGRAAALVRGPFLAGFNLRDSPEFDDWRASRSSAVERQVIDVLERVAARQTAAGDLAGAVTTATRQLDLDPLAEPAHRRLIALLADGGDRAGAIRQYRMCVATLERELGVGPLAETTALYESIRDGSYLRRESPAEAHQANQVATRVPADGQQAGRQPLPFVGRERELGQLMAAHAEVAHDGRLAVIEGEPGIGKTRLADEVLAALAARGARSLVARAHASEAGIAYAPIAEALRGALADGDVSAPLERLPDETLAELGRIVALPARFRRPAPSAADAIDPALARARLLDALATALTSVVGGALAGVLLVDDLQWADASTLELIAYLVRRLEGRPLLLLLTWRHEDLGAPALSVTELAEASTAARIVRLARLGPEAITRLVAAALPAGRGAIPSQMLQALTEASEGLPLYLAERLAERPDVHPPATAVSIPHGFRALLRERLGRVGETAVQVLAAGAVIGRSFDLPTVRLVSGRSEDEAIAALEELLRRGLIRESAWNGGVRFDFAHASLREAAYEETSLVRRRVLHRRVAEVLRAGSDHPGVGPDLARLVLIAQHERDAGRDAEAAEAFRSAAQRARAIFANREAIELVESALALGHPEVAALQRTLGELRLGLGDYPEAIAAFEVSAALTTGLPLVELELLLGRAHARRGDLGAAASHLDAALAGCLAEEPGTLACRRVRIRVLAERSVVALRAGDLALAVDQADEALSIGSEIHDDAGAGMARRIRGLIARSSGDLASARADLAESLRLSEGDPDPGAGIAAANALALVEAAAGQSGMAISLLERALASARRVGERHLEAAILNNLADSYHAAGDDDRSMEHLRAAVAIFAEIGGGPGELEPEIWKLETW